MFLSGHCSVVAVHVVVIQGWRGTHLLCRRALHEHEHTPGAPDSVQMIDPN